jgi:short-subunit dehydrogenase
LQSSSESLKNVLITGATKGIGKALCKILAASGRYNMAVCARTDKDLADLAANLKQDFPNLHILYKSCDLSDKKSILQFTEYLKGNNFKTNILVNNAGIFMQNALTTEPDNALEKLMAVNLYGPYYLTREIIPGMKKAKNGTIINIGSVAGIKGFSNAGTYTITKHALLGFSRSLREELKPYGIRVCSVLAGATLTNAWNKTQWPENRFMKAEDVAMTVQLCMELSGNSVAEEIILRPLQGDINDEPNTTI